MYKSLFENMPDSFNDGRAEYRWDNVENIPDCKKYTLKNLEDVEFVPDCGYQDYVKVRLPIWDVLSSLREDALLLRVFRWNRVKSHFSEGKVHYPIVYFNKDDEKPSLGDGRHRLVALMRFYGATEADFLCDPDHYGRIYQFIKNNN